MLDFWKANQADLMFSFDFSRDGKQLAVSRGKHTSAEKIFITDNGRVKILDWVKRTSGLKIKVIKNNR